jgi:hypothetical protein
MLCGEDGGHEPGGARTNYDDWGHAGNLAVKGVEGA